MFVLGAALPSIELSDVRRTTGSDHLGRYYTCDDVSNFLVNQMGALKPMRVLDLGSGSGSLSLAAMTKWHTAEFLTVDVDESAGRRLGAAVETLPQNPRHRHLLADALRFDLPELLTKSAPTIDTAICNPPFIVPKWKRGFGSILEDAGFSSCLPVLSTVDAALLFLAQNLRLLKPDGTLGIILPDTLISSSRYRAFRHSLLDQYCVEKAIRLPRRSFYSTDALAHILVISKRRATTEQLWLYRLSTDHRLSDGLIVTNDKATERMDYDFHAGSNTEISRRATTAIKLGNIVTDLKRGHYSSYEARSALFPVLHTTDMTVSKLARWCDLRRFGTKTEQLLFEASGIVVASPGDILIGRVGRNLEDKVLGVAAGFPILTDCVFRLRVSKRYRDETLAQLASSRGREWLASRAYGVGARQITKADLLSFPVSL